MKTITIFFAALLFTAMLNAQTAIAPAVGNGSTINPYQIATWQNLYWISQSVYRWDKHYIQTADITFPAEINQWNDGKGWTPIGKSSYAWPPEDFSGTYNGHGKKITDLFINNPDKSNVGLFGAINEYGKISNLSLESLYIEGSGNVGGLVGKNEGEIINCFTQGEIIGLISCGGLVGYEWGRIAQSGSSCSVTGMNNVGGMVGENSQILFDCSVSGMDSENGLAGSKSYIKGIYECYATGDVSGEYNVGGFVGHNDGSIYKSFATGIVYLNGDYGESFGGFVGWNHRYIEDSWCKGDVNGHGWVGGFVGVNGLGWDVYEYLDQCIIINCYCIGWVNGDYYVGAFAGWNYYYEDLENSEFSEAMVWDSFYNYETAGGWPDPGEIGMYGISNYNVSGISTAEMQSRATFIDAGWDFQCETDNGEEYTWGVNSNDNNQYPFLSWQGFISEGCPQWTGAIGTDWDEPGNWLDNIVPPLGSSVYVPDGLSNYPAINQNQTVVDLSIEEGTSLTISPLVNLDVEGTFNNQAGASSFVIGSNQSGTASLIHNSAGLEGTMQRFIPGYESKGSTGWHLLASPVENFEIAGSDFEPDANDDLYVWDEVNYQWLNYKIAQNNITHFISGKGYLVAYQDDASRDFEGTFHYTDVTHIDLVKTIGMGDGWHLLGNPFQSALQWDEDSWDLNNVSAGAKILNQGGTYTDIVTEGANEYIPANQGFFVQVSDDADNSITIPADSRVHDATPYYKNQKPDLLTLRLASGGYYAETWIQALESATPEFDQKFDMPFFGGMYNAPQFFSYSADNEILSTNRIPEITKETTVQLGFKSFFDGEFTISANNANSFEGKTDLYLQDAETGEQINLKEVNEYVFQAVQDETSQRFSIQFIKTTGIGQATNEASISMNAQGNTLVIETDKPQNASIAVYNLTGQQVYSKSLWLDGETHLSLNLPSGFYLVQLSSEHQSFGKKILIH